MIYTAPRYHTLTLFFSAAWAQTGVDRALLGWASISGGWFKPCSRQEPVGQFPWQGIHVIRVGGVKWRGLCNMLLGVLQSLHVDARSFSLEADLDEIDKLVYYCLSGYIEAVWWKHPHNNYTVMYFRCFNKDSVEEIILALEENGSDWSKKQLEVCALISMCFAVRPCKASSFHCRLSAKWWALMTVDDGWYIDISPLLTWHGLSLKLKICCALGGAHTSSLISVQPLYPCTTAEV